MSLNQMKPEFENLIAPTDSRFRPDVKQLELGNLGWKNNISCLLNLVISKI